MELIPVSKDGDYIEIHPATLADHKRIGWLECERQDAQSDINGDGKVTAAELRAAGYQIIDAVFNPNPVEAEHADKPKPGRKPKAVEAEQAAE